jgi:hypothetical protein
MLHVTCHDMPSLAFPKLLLQCCFLLSPPILTAIRWDHYCLRTHWCLRCYYAILLITLALNTLLLPTLYIIVSPILLYCHCNIIRAIVIDAENSLYGYPSYCFPLLRIDYAYVCYHIRLSPFVIHLRYADNGSTPSMLFNAAIAYYIIRPHISIANPSLRQKIHYMPRRHYALSHTLLAKNKVISCRALKIMVIRSAPLRHEPPLLCFSRLISCWFSKSPLALIITGCHTPPQYATLLPLYCHRDNIVTLRHVHYMSSPDVIGHYAMRCR